MFGKGTWDDGDYMCPECISSYIEKSEHSGQKQKMNNFNKKPLTSQARKPKIMLCF
jgi:hypothetical protein